MKNKGFVVALTIVVTLLCIYYLSFTFVSRNLTKQATEFSTDLEGNQDFQKKQRFLDSLWSEPVYNFLGVEFTLKEVKQTELAFGLDLQGGMHVVLEVSPIEVLKALAGNNLEPEFLEALKEARKQQMTSQEKFLDLFYASYKTLKPEGRLAEIFTSTANKDRINFQSTDEEVLKVLGAEIDDAVDRTYTILRTRIDKFGVTQPNIQKLEGSGRIQVELPGAENPSRVRNYLQSVAKLEFFEVFEPNEFLDFMLQANDYIVEKEKAEKSLESERGDTVQEGGLENLSLEPVESISGDDDLAVQEDLSVNDLSPVDDLSPLLDSGASDSIGGLAATLDSGLEDADTTRQPTDYSILLRGVTQQGQLIYTGADTMQVNKYLKDPKIKAFFPKSLTFLWSVKEIGSNQETDFYELFPIKSGRKGKAHMEGDVITNARHDIAQNGRGYEISMSMNAQGAKKWKRLTGENIDRKIAIVLDHRVYSAPTVQGEIPGGRSSITGSFTLEEAKDLANILKAGALPAPARIVEEAIVGSTLGEESIRQGVLSIVAGLILVVLFMIMYYNKGGAVADFALLINIFFILGILAQLNAALTLPGIAGIVLTIGMSIDANVLIFERIREELRGGKGLLNAIKLGYEKAFSSIIDSNVTTFLTGVILYSFGSGPVKGFAVTLMIGIACSFFSAVFITRVVVEWMTRKNRETGISFRTRVSKGVLANTNINIIGRRKIAYILSSILIIIGMVLIFMQGGLNLGVDFTGGRSYVVKFDQPIAAADVRSSLSNAFEDKSVEVKTYGSNNTVKITTGYLVNDESDVADSLVLTAMNSGLENFSALNPEIMSSNKVGATIADDIKGTAWESILYSLAVIFFYILIRFRRWQFGLGALVALLHDVLVVFSAIAISRAIGIAFEIDQVFIAALLTIIGYSINDTVVVFDRVREYLREHYNPEVAVTLNNSINSTLNRTVITSLTTLLVILVLLIFGGEALRGFSFALFIGVLIGTYSSIFIATPIVLETSRKDLAQEASEAKNQARATVAGV
jgi:SecD/SecF fusion protein